jgi:hypothetical protein
VVVTTPAAPGFDATLLGGSSVVRRSDGQTLRDRLNAATRSSPDAPGLIDTPSSTAIGLGVELEDAQVQRPEVTHTRLRTRRRCS